MTGRIAKAALCGLLMMSAQVHASDRVRAPYMPDSGSLASRCGVLIDGISDEARMDQIVVIRDGRIASVQPGSARTAKSLQAIDLSAYTCLPGLIIKGGLVFKIPAEVNQ
jgi:imidazolonepropionase-like amidohydrolase